MGQGHDLWVIRNVFEFKGLMEIYLHMAELQRQMEHKHDPCKRPFRGPHITLTFNLCFVIASMGIDIYVYMRDNSQFSNC